LVTVNPPPSLSIQRSSPNLTLAWPVGILQSVTNLSGTWADVPGANTPYTNTSEGPQQFFRLRLQ
jgi:hypothetical protein